MGFYTLSSPVHADDESFSMVPIVLLILIIIILVIVLVSIRLPVVLLSAERHSGRLRSRPQLELPEEEEQPLIQEEHGALPDDELQRMTEEIEKLRRELFSHISQNTELQHRCETLSRELEGARVFLNTADLFSDSEVVQMLAKLNAELQHTTTFMADRVFDTFKLGVITPEPEQSTGPDRTLDSIGSTLMQFLRDARRDDPEVPMYLQIAFQAYLAHHLCWIVSSWTLAHEHNKFINEMYQGLRETERQAISGRWRSLTRIYALPTCVSDPNALVTPIIAGVSVILLAAGCADSRSDIVSELSSMFEKKISTAISLAGRLNQMMNGHISGDFEVYAVRPDEAFDAEMMEEDTDNNEDGTQWTPSVASTETPQTILCTSELGLMKRVQLGTGESDTKTVIRAKVILESFLNSERR